MMRFLRITIVPLGWVSILVTAAIGCANNEKHRPSAPKRTAGAGSNTPRTRTQDAEVLIQAVSCKDAGNCECQDGEKRSCYEGDQALAGVGICKHGSQTCKVSVATTEFVETSWGDCSGQGSPKREVCGNELDDDCDGDTDESCPCKDGWKVDCTNACGSGTRVCERGELTPCSAPEPKTESCNGVDDDCDDRVDELEESCTSECGKGTRSCVDGKWGDCSARSPRAESCNGMDDDCDGVIDQLTRSCTSACGAGSEHCEDGEWGSCSADEPAAESCNGMDDDCDGVVDRISRPCTSACGAGSERCEDGEWGECSAPKPAAESCNGVDDDCDGKVDGMSRSCTSACGTGSERCSSGSWAGCTAPAPQSETCDMRDNDCDGTVDEGLRTVISFVNLCSVSQVFITLGGCNVCAMVCQGFWVAPGQAFNTELGPDECVTVSAVASTPNGDFCLDGDGNGNPVGQTRDICYRSCLPGIVGMSTTQISC